MVNILTGIPFGSPKRLNHREDEGALEFPSSAGSRARNLLALRAQNWRATGGTMDIGQVISDWYSGTLEGDLTISSATLGNATKLPKQQKLVGLYLPNVTSVPQVLESPKLETFSAPLAQGTAKTNTFVRMTGLRHVELNSITSIEFAAFNSGVGSGIEIFFGNITSIATNFIANFTAVGARIHIAKTQAEIRAMMNFPFGLPSDTVFVGTDGEFSA